MSSACFQSPNLFPHLHIQIILLFYQGIRLPPTTIFPVSDFSPANLPAADQKSNKSRKKLQFLTFWPPVWQLIDWPKYFGIVSQQLPDPSGPQYTAHQHLDVSIQAHLEISLMIGDKQWQHGSFCRSWMSDSQQSLTLQNHQSLLSDCLWLLMLRHSHWQHKCTLNIQITSCKVATTVTLPAAIHSTIWHDLSLVSHKLFSQWKCENNIQLFCCDVMQDPVSQQSRSPFSFMLHSGRNLLLFVFGICLEALETSVLK